jgi:ribosomal protein S18 acetylase RimI-like enzyme
LCRRAEPGQEEACVKGLEIRPFVMEDTDGVLEVWNLTGMTGPDRKPPRSEIQKMMSHAPESFFVGLVEGRIAATVMVGYDGHRGWIYLLAVTPDLQKRGIGRKMVEHAESGLRQLGCPIAKLQIDASHTDAVGFYQKLGYEVRELISMRKVFRASDS